MVAFSRVRVPGVGWWWGILVVVLGSPGRALQQPPPPPRPHHSGTQRCCHDQKVGGEQPEDDRCGDEEGVLSNTNNPASSRRPQPRRRRSFLLACGGGLCSSSWRRGRRIPPAWSSTSRWQDYTPAPIGSTTDDIIQSATAKATDRLVQTLQPAQPVTDGTPRNSTTPPPIPASTSAAASIASSCYLECFRKFGDSLVPATEYDISVYCTSRCFEEVATSSAVGLHTGSATFCQAYEQLTGLEFFGCDY